MPLRDLKGDNNPGSGTIASIPDEVGHKGVKRLDNVGSLGTSNILDISTLQEVEFFKFGCTEA